jgi:hypothetical protein
MYLPLLKNTNLRLLLSALTLFFISLPHSYGTPQQAIHKSGHTNAASQEEVSVGIWPLSFYNIDTKANTFNASAFVWFRWKGDIDPTESFSFLNSVDGANFKKEDASGGTMKVKDDGKEYNYKCFKIDGKFSQPFDLKRFPLDHQTLQILIEDSSYYKESLVFKPDTIDSGLDSDLRIPGWNIQDSKIDTFSKSHTYKTGWGAHQLPDAHRSEYSQIIYSVKIWRPPTFFIWKMMLPVLMVLIANWTGLLLHPNHVSARITMSGTALLTSVFLSQGYLANIADTNHLVLMDKIYAAVFILIIASLIQILIQGALFERQIKDNYKKAVRVDRASVLAQALVFIAYLAFILN